MLFINQNILTRFIWSLIEAPLNFMTTPRSIDPHTVPPLAKNLRVCVLAEIIVYFTT